MVNSWLFNIKCEWSTRVISVCSGFWEYELPSGERVFKDDMYNKELGYITDTQYKELLDTFFQDNSI